MVYGKMVNTYRLTSLPCNLLHTVNPLLSPPGAYLFQAHLRGGGGGLFYFTNDGGVSSPQKTRVQSGQAQVQVLGHREFTVLYLKLVYILLLYINKTYVAREHHHATLTTINQSVYSVNVVKSVSKIVDS